MRASEQENPDLFWGLRGGGGNFGVVTKFEYKLHPVGPEIVGGVIAWKGEDANDVLELYRTLTEQAPPELTSVVLLRPAPPAPWLPKEIHGKPIAAILVCHSGTIEEGERLVTPIKAFGSPIGDVIQRRPYITQQSLLDATQPKGRRYYWKSEYLPGHDPQMLEKFAEHGSYIKSPHSAIILFQLDGALNKIPVEHSPVGNRKTKTVLNITASWESPEDDRENIEWARNAWQDLRRFSTGGTYVNFLTEEEVGDRLQDAWGKNYDRLVEIKTKW
ncbi:FAD-binding oxidoreductase, partial [candidate division KSB1 bacterium]|nr:FAD-binding oxidoreductase [candidate division KSB1 bacterium]NIT70364.1 FAD-binding oxidoreductase [candidate division KSB1 bacterium]NIU24063.1 FAD-binding oxidoreductase [candidate division KSB1 bacterium]NIU92877.1 FAD-binding oxidoreductase [candidate division KSB1 bacterium]NIV95398.1 FAD-binding oxidoreductase [candidate division KSB1 bacterium]